MFHGKYCKLPFDPSKSGYLEDPKTPQTPIQVQTPSISSRLTVDKHFALIQIKVVQLKHFVESCTLLRCCQVVVHAPSMSPGDGWKKCVFLKNLLMQEILHPLGCLKSMYIMRYLPYQLMQDFFHQQQFIYVHLCLQGFTRVFLAPGNFKSYTGLHSEAWLHHFVWNPFTHTLVRLQWVFGSVILTPFIPITCVVGSRYSTQII